MKLYYSPGACSQAPQRLVRARELQLWQWVLSKDGVHGGYRRAA